MASINWPSALSDVLVSNATVSEPGLAGWWSMNTVSEYPTGTATYFQDAWATVDGWVARSTSCTVSVASGKLVASGNNTQAFTAVRSPAISGLAGKTVRIKIEVNSSSTVTIQYYDGVSVYTTFSTTSVSVGVPRVIDALVPGGAVDFLVVSSTGGTAIVNFDWIYIGDGSYAANSLLDNSGNGLHGQIFGCTPVDGVSGKALIGEGTNDYTVTPSVSSFGVGRTTSVSLWCNLAGTSGYVFSYPDAVNNNGFYLQVVGANQLRFIVNNSQTIHTATLPSGNNHIVAIRDQTTGRASMFVNGAQVADVAITTPPTVDANTSFYLFANTNVSGFLNATIDEPRSYTRALSAAEVLYLYQNPSPYTVLPNAPLQDGYSETKQNGVIRSSVDAGAPKMRQRFTAVTRQYNVSFALTSNMAQILDYFYYTTTSQGVALFNWTDPRTGASVEARFIEPPVHRPNGPEYVTSCTLEVLP